MKWAFARRDSSDDKSFSVPFLGHPLPTGNPAWPKDCGLHGVNCGTKFALLGCPDRLCID